MGDDPGDNIQNQNLISDDVASALAAATTDSQSNTPNSTPDVKPPLEPIGQTPPAMPNQDAVPTTGDSQVGEESSVGSINQTTPTGQPTTPEELHKIKQQALKQLGPMVGHLQQTPQERFDTLMMMIRASDDETLIKPAYEAALQIEDDNKKAQALLDVVNEVNYLTQPNKPTQQ